MVVSNSTQPHETNRHARRSLPSMTRLRKDALARAAAIPKGGTNMQISDILAQTGGLQSMAKELGVSEAQAAQGAQALMPALLGGFKKQAQTAPGGIAGLGGLLGKLGGGLLDDVVSPRPTDLNRGNSVLGQVFGSKDVSRAVADNAASQSGLNPALLKRMLPMLAMAVAGYMAKQGASAAAPRPQQGQVGGVGGLGGMVNKLFGGQSNVSRAAGGQSQGGLASMLDMDGDGNPLDDIMSIVRKARR